MAKSPPSLEAIAAQVRAFSSTKGGPITEREWNRHPERLCSGTAVRRLFQRSSWHDVLRDCGVTPHDPRSSAYVAHWVLAYHAERHRWPQKRDFHRPCGYWLVKKVFHEADNAVAAAVQHAKDLLKTLEAQGVGLAEYLANHFITVTPRRLPSTAPVAASARLYGAPTGYRWFPYAPTCENGVLVLFGMLVRDGRLKPEFLVESVSAHVSPDSMVKRYVPGRQGYIDESIEFKLRSADYRAGRDKPCDYLVCWEDNWPVGVPRPTAHILSLAEVIRSGRR